MITTRKAQLLDVVEMLEDLPEYGIKRGEKGAVVEVFDEPEEAYIVEFVDESGKSRIAYWVNPDQIITVDELAKDIFERGVSLLNTGKLFEAEVKFRQAIHLKPDYIGVLHNSIVNSFKGSEEWQRAITAMQLVFRLNPNYEIARHNLAIAYQKYGIQKDKEGKIGDAIELLQMALSLGPSAEIISDIKNSIAALFTSEGIRQHEDGQIINVLKLMNQANLVDPNEKTRDNLGIAYIHLAQDCLNKGDLNNALIAFERAELTGIMSAQLLNDYGFALAHADRVEEAINIFERALELAPENEIIQTNLKSIRGSITTDLSKEESKIEFASDLRTEETFVETGLLAAMNTPVYTIDFKNFAAA